MTTRSNSAANGAALLLRYAAPGARTPAYVASVPRAQSFGYGRRYSTPEAASVLYSQPTVATTQCSTPRTVSSTSPGGRCGCLPYGPDPCYPVHMLGATRGRQLPCRDGAPNYVHTSLLQIRGSPRYHWDARGTPYVLVACLLRANRAELSQGGCTKPAYLLICRSTTN